MPVPPANGPAAAAHPGYSVPAQIQIGALVAASLPLQIGAQPMSQHRPGCVCGSLEFPVHRFALEFGPLHLPTRGAGAGHVQTASWSVRWGDPNIYLRLIGSQHGLADPGASQNSWPIIGMVKGSWCLFLRGHLACTALPTLCSLSPVGSEGPGSPERQELQACLFNI